MFRFYVNEKKENKFILSENNINHIKVARVTNEDFICVYKGDFFVCRLDGNFALIVKELDEKHDFNGEVIMAAGFISIKKFELLIQKATELGATKLIPVISNNISAKIPNDINKKLIRWNQISLNASEQSFRNRQMIIEPPMILSDVLDIKIENKFIAHEKNESTPIISYPQDSLFLVGPEGGFTENEVKSAQLKGFKEVSLGKRILRAETAAMYLLSRVN